MAKKKIKPIDKVSQFLIGNNALYDIIVITLENKNQIPTYKLGLSGDKEINIAFPLDFINYSFGCMEGSYVYFRGAGCYMHFSPEAITKSLGNDEEARDRKLHDFWMRSAIAIDSYTIIDNKIFLLMNYRNRGQRHDFYSEWKKYRQYQHDDMHGELIFKHEGIRREIYYTTDMVEFIDKNSLNTEKGKLNGKK